MATRAQIASEVMRIVEAVVTDLSDAIPTHIQRAQRAIEDRCIFRVQDAETTIEVIPGTLNYTKPDDFISMRECPYFMPTVAISAEASAGSVQRTMLGQVEGFQSLGNTLYQAPPRYWADETEIEWGFWPRGDSLGPGASGSYEVIMPYHKRLATLDSDSSSNFWSEKMDDVLAWKAAAMVFAELRDPASQFWNAVAAARFIEIKGQYKRNRMRLQGGSITPSSSLSGRTERNSPPYRRIQTRVPSS